MDTQDSKATSLSVYFFIFALFSAPVFGNDFKSRTPLDWVDLDRKTVKLDFESQSFFNTRKSERSRSERSLSLKLEKNQGLVILVDDLKDRLISQCLESFQFTKSNLKSLLSWIDQTVEYHSENSILGAIANADPYWSYYEDCDRWKVEFAKANSKIFSYVAWPKSAKSKAWTIPWSNYQMKPHSMLLWGKNRIEEIEFWAIESQELYPLKGQLGAAAQQSWVNLKTSTALNFTKWTSWLKSGAYLFETGLVEIKQNRRNRLRDRAADQLDMLSDGLSNLAEFLRQSSAISE